MAAPVVLITGAAHRLGAHTAETLHGRGWNVVIHYRSRQEQARQLIDKLNRERTDSATSVPGKNRLRALAAAGRTGEQRFGVLSQPYRDRHRR